LKKVVLKIQSNGYPLIQESDELTTEELERITRLFQTIVENRRKSLG